MVAGTRVRCWVGDQFWPCGPFWRWVSKAGEHGGVRAVGWSARVRIWDRLAASDPGLLRLIAGLRTVCAIGLTIAVLAVLRVPVPLLVAGAIAAMVSTFAVRDKQRGRQAGTLALGLPVALVSLSLGTLLGQQIVAGDLFFVVLIFGAVYARRFGDRSTALGEIGFQTYFLSLFVRATPPMLPQLYGVICVAFGCSALARFALLPQTPTGVLDRLRQAFRARLGQLIDIQIELLDAGPDEVEKVLEALRTGTARLHETALLIQSRLEDGISDEAVARL